MLPAAWIINTIKNIIEGDRKYRALYAHLPCNSQQKDLKKSASLVIWTTFLNYSHL